MCPASQLVVLLRQLLVPISPAGWIRSSDSTTPPWHDAQFDANTAWPRCRRCLSPEMYPPPPGAAASDGGVVVVMNLHMLTTSCSAAAKSGQSRRHWS